MSGTTTNPYRFGGQVGYRRDSPARQYVRARHLDTSRGRWTSRDPLGFEGGDANLYRYVGNRPAVYCDGSGMALIGLNVPCRADACQDMVQNNCNAVDAAACRSACTGCGGSVITMCVVDKGDMFAEESCYCHCSPCSSATIAKNQKKVQYECKPRFAPPRWGNELCRGLSAPRDCHQLKIFERLACACDIARNTQNQQCYCGGNRTHKFEADEAHSACTDCRGKAKRCP